MEEGGKDTEKQRDGSMMKLQPGVAGSEHRGRGHGPENVHGLWELEKARKLILSSCLWKEQSFPRPPPPAPGP